MPASSSIRLVCFDLGGVLLRICRSWREACSAAGLEVRAQFPDDPSASNGFSTIGAAYQTGRIACADYAAQLARAVNALYSTDEVMAIHHAWLRHEYAGVGAVIDDLHAAGIATACLSNTNHAHWTRMREFPSIMKLGVRLASHELGCAKPDAAVYRAFESKVSRRGDEILFFDDLAANVAAARVLGWRAAEIDPAGDTAAQMRAELARLRVLGAGTHGRAQRR